MEKRNVCKVNRKQRIKAKAQSKMKNTNESTSKV